MTSPLKAPYLLFLGKARTLSEAKTAAGIAYWRRDLCCGQLRLPGCEVDIGLPDRSLEEAQKYGTRSLVIGIAPMGGQLEPEWIDVICRAVRLGYDIVSGMHTRLNSIPGLAESAKARGSRLVDVRIPPPNIKVATGKKRPGKRILTVGTDCAVGKKYSALALERALHARGYNATFRATGQTGIMIAGDGIPIDAVISDFVAGAAEALSPANQNDHWDVIEGQGSLFHPSYAAVTMGLIHGSQPDALLLCHDLSRTMIDDVEGFRIPHLNTCIARYVEAASLTNPAVKCIGVSVNSSGIDDYPRHRDAIETETGLPCVDPIFDGAEKLVTALEKAFPP